MLTTAHQDHDTHHQEGVLHREDVLPEHDRRRDRGREGPARRSRGRRAGVLAVVVLAVLAGGACGSSRSDTSSTAAPTAARGAPAEGSTGKDANTAAGSKTGQAATSPTGDPASFNAQVDGANDPQAGRSVISSATLTVNVDDVAVAKDAAATAAEKAGGYVFAEQTSFGSSSTARLTLKVPPPAFRRLLDDLGHLGALDAQQVKTDDVTQQVVDLQSRITATEASLERTRALLGGAKSITELSQLENEVVRRQSDLESLRGQQKTLEAKVDLATVDVTLAGKADATPAKQEEQRRREEEERKKHEDKPLPGFFDGLSGGLGVARDIGSVLLAAVGALLPFVPLLLLGYVVVRLARWSSRRRAPGATAGPPPPAAAAGGPGDRPTA